MQSVSITKASKHFSQLVHLVTGSQQPILIVCHSRPTAAVIPASWLHEQLVGIHPEKPEVGAVPESDEADE